MAPSAGSTSHTTATAIFQCRHRVRGSACSSVAVRQSLRATPFFNAAIVLGAQLVQRSSVAVRQSLRAMSLPSWMCKAFYANAALDLFVFLVPGAFAVPDPRSQKRHSKSQLRIYNEGERQSLQSDLALLPLCLGTLPQ